MVAMLPADADALSAGAAEKRIHGPVTESRCKKKAPRKVHKAEREKHKRDLLNDLFGELGDMLEADRQNNGKACILTDTTRILRDLLSQLESLRKENSTLLNESHYVTMERNELQDENGVLRNEILELQNTLATRLAGNPGWDHGAAGVPLTVPHSASTGFPSQQPMQSPVIANAIFPTLQQPAPPRELKLFPDAASDIEGPEPSEDQEAPNHVARPQARYPTESAAWPVSLGLPRMEDEQCSSSTTGSSKEGSSGSD
ncbi:protein IRON-RELATED TRANSCRIPTION FACTOR 3-like [Lolium rigidum]|uniref:protein IRON-RELATED TRANSCRIPTION FACTOR 3-like n=1 Tax=Lolium rigidum TaxID=89674 RepID=UPI001F5CD57F|nr:protein IRON-RELATED TRANSCRIPTION FACTOR 3-like [Lolium rigidum]